MTERSGRGEAAGSPAPPSGPGAGHGPEIANGPATADLLRTGLLGLAALGIAGTAVELVFLRHWGDVTRTIVWPGIVALALALVVIGRARRPRTVQVVRVLVGLAVLVAVAGVGFHVLENLDAGPLDRDYALSWAGLPVVEQLWLATTGGVGPAPVLAPGALAEIALAILLATFRHPALRAAPEAAAVRAAPEAAAVRAAPEVPAIRAAPEETGSRR